MLVEFACIDAYLASKSDRNIISGVSHSGMGGSSTTQFDGEPVYYTDYTQTTIAIAEMIISGQPWTLETLSEQLLSVVKRDPRTGDAKKFWRFLQSMGQQPYQIDVFTRNDYYRAVIRAIPIGFYPTIQEVITKASLQVEIAGVNGSLRDGAIAIALAAHYCIYDLGQKSNLSRYLQVSVPKLNLASQKYRGIMSIQAAVTAIERNDRMSALLTDCLTYAADLQTTAMIALAVGSCCREITYDLPDYLMEQLENGTYGREYLQQLDHQLSAVISN